MIPRTEWRTAFCKESRGKDSIGKKTNDSNYRHDSVHRQLSLDPVRCSGVVILRKNVAFSIIWAVEVYCFLIRIYRLVVVIEHNLRLIEENLFSKLRNFQWQKSILEKRS